MKTVVASLYELQKIQILSQTPASEALIHRLHEKIPADILDVYERFRVRGRKAVALIRNGVCGECHLRIPTGTLVDVMHGDQLMRCGNCGRFLYLPGGGATTVSTCSSAAVVPASPAPQPIRRGAPSAPRPRRKRTEITAQAA